MLRSVVSIVWGDAALARMLSEKPLPVCLMIWAILVGKWIFSDMPLTVLSGSCEGFWCKRMFSDVCQTMAFVSDGLVGNLTCFRYCSFDVLIDQDSVSTQALLSHCIDLLLLSLVCPLLSVSLVRSLSSKIHLFFTWESGKWPLELTHVFLGLKRRTLVCPLVHRFSTVGVDILLTFASVGQDGCHVSLQSWGKQPLERRRCKTLSIKGLISAVFSSDFLSLASSGRDSRFLSNISASSIASLPRCRFFCFT